MNLYALPGRRSLLRRRDADWMLDTGLQTLVPRTPRRARQALRLAEVDEVLFRNPPRALVLDFEDTAGNTATVELLRLRGWRGHGRTAPELDALERAVAATIAPTRDEVIGALRPQSSFLRHVSATKLRRSPLAYYCGGPRFELPHIPIMDW